MLSILSITAPIYLLILLGYACVRGGLFARTDMRVLGQFVLRLALPALLFRTLAQRRVGDILNPHYLAAYAGGSLAVLGLGWWWMRKRPGSYRALFAMGVSSSNSGFVGAPVLLQWMGPGSGVALALTLMVENLLVLPLALALAEHGADGHVGTGAAMRRAIVPMARNPLLIAIVVGVVFSAFGLALAAPLQRTVDLLAAASAPVALFVIGGTLVGLDWHGQRADLAAVATGKLLVHPLAVGALMAWALPAQPQLRHAAIALAAMPMLSIYPVLAQKYHHDGFCAAALLVTTAASFFTLSALIGWFGA